jgi:hypothetical protein
MNKSQVKKKKKEKKRKKKGKKRRDVKPNASLKIKTKKLVTCFVVFLGRRCL